MYVCSFYILEVGYARVKRGIAFLRGRLFRSEARTRSQHRPPTSPSLACLLFNVGLPADHKQSLKSRIAQRSTWTRLPNQPNATGTQNQSHRNNRRHLVGSHSPNRHQLPERTCIIRVETKSHARSSPKLRLCPLLPKLRLLLRPALFRCAARDSPLVPWPQAAWSSWDQRGLGR